MGCNAKSECSATIPKARPQKSLLQSTGRWTWCIVTHTWPLAPYASYAARLIKARISIARSITQHNMLHVCILQFGDWREGTPRGAYAGVLFAPWTGGPEAVDNSSGSGIHGGRRLQSAAGSQYGRPAWFGGAQRRLNAIGAAGSGSRKVDGSGAGKGGSGGREGSERDGEAAASDAAGQQEAYAKNKRAAGRALAAGAAPIASAEEAAEKTIFLVPSVHFVERTSNIAARLYIAGARDALGLNEDGNT